MDTLLRSLILWLALLAVPFQGFAAATMLPCAPAASTPQADAHGMQAAGHGHAAMHQHAAPRGHSANDSGAAHGHHAGAKCGNCGGTCAACCIGAAIAPAPTLAVASIAPQSVSIPFDAGHLPAVHPTLPERPPKSSLA